VSQRAALSALQGPQEWTYAIRDAFQANRDRLVEQAGKLPRVAYVIPEGNPNLFLDFTATGLAAAEVATYLLERHGIRTTPGECFQTPGHVRLEFGGNPETIVEVGRRLVRAATELAQDNTR
jgi:aspartate/methionine/tyrosine aminotransferase